MKFKHKEIFSLSMHAQENGVYIYTLVPALLSQLLKSLQLDTAKFDTITEEGESTVRCCLSNTRLLLVTVNAERASEIEKVSTEDFYFNKA